MVSFASSATTGGTRKHAWTNKRPIAAWPSLAEPGVSLRGKAGG